MDYLEKQIINFQRCTGLVQGKLGPEREKVLELYLEIPHTDDRSHFPI